MSRVMLAVANLAFVLGFLMFVLAFALLAILVSALLTMLTGSSYVVPPVCTP